MYNVEEVDGEKCNKLSETLYMLMNNSPMDNKIQVVT